MYCCAYMVAHSILKCDTHRPKILRERTVDTKVTLLHEQSAVDVIRPCWHVRQRESSSHLLHTYIACLALFQFFG